MAYTDFAIHDAGAVPVVELFGETNDTRSFFSVQKPRRMEIAGNGNRRTLTFVMIVGQSLVVENVSRTRAFDLRDRFFDPNSFKALSSLRYPDPKAEGADRVRGIIKTAGVDVEGTMELWSTDPTPVKLEYVNLQSCSHARSRESVANPQFTIDMVVLLTSGEKYVARDVHPQRMAEWRDAMIAGVWGGPRNVETV